MLLLRVGPGMCMDRPAVSQQPRDRLDASWSFQSPYNFLCCSPCHAIHKPSANWFVFSPMSETMKTEGWVLFFSGVPTPSPGFGSEEVLGKWWWGEQVNEWVAHPCPSRALALPGVGSGWVSSPHDSPYSPLQAPGLGHLRWDRAHWEPPLGAGLVSPGSLDHLLFLHLEGDQVHRKGKRCIFKQLATGREGHELSLYEITGDPESAREFTLQKSALLCGSRRTTGLGVHSGAQS